jgi:Flp pilus assembly protein TadD
LIFPSDIEPYRNLLAVQAAGDLEIDLIEQVRYLRRAAKSFKPHSGPTSDRIGQLAGSLILPNLRSQPVAQQNALVDGHRIAARYDPTPTRSNYLGITLYKLGRFGEAEAAFREALLRDPDDAVARNNLGHTLSKLDRSVEAEAAFRQALLRDPDYVFARDGLGSLLRNLGRFGAAEAVFREALLRDPDDADAHNGLGTVLVVRGYFGKGESAFREALRCNPDHTQAHNNLGLTLYNLGRLGEAEAAFREALLRDPDYAPAHYTLGHTLRDLGRPVEAEAAFREALRHDSSFQRVHYGIGLLRLAYGRTEEAEQEFAAAGEEAYVELYLWALERARRANGTNTLRPHRILTAIERPLPADRIPFSPFAVAEIRALALLGLGKSREAISEFRAGLAKGRRPSDRFNRPLYDLLLQPEPLPNLDELLVVWHEIIADDPTASGP